MAQVSINQTDYIFTASVYTSQSPTITDGAWTITVATVAGNSVSIATTNTQVNIVDQGIMTVLSASTATIVEATGNGVQTEFNLPTEVLAIEYVEVVVGGVLQNPGSGDSFTVQLAIFTK